MARWPFGRRRSAAEEESERPRPARGQQAWLRLPHLRPTVSWRAPATVDVLHEPSAVRTRWLPRPPTATSSLDAPRGRVRGILRVLTAMPAGAGELVLPRPRPVRRRARRARIAADSSWPVAADSRWPLTVVTEDNVEPPIEPAEPFIPAIALADLPWEHGWSEPEVADPASAQVVDSPDAIDPLGLLAMGVAAMEEPPEEVWQRPTSLTRATLAESRRRGLGMPSPNAPGPQPLADSDPIPGDDAEPSPVEVGAPEVAHLPADTVENPPENSIERPRPPSAAGPAPVVPTPTAPTPAARTRRDPSRPVATADDAGTAQVTPTPEVQARRDPGGPVATAEEAHAAEAAERKAEAAEEVEAAGEVGEIREAGTTEEFGETEDVGETGETEGTAPDQAAGRADVSPPPALVHLQPGTERPGSPAGPAPARRPEPLEVSTEPHEVSAEPPGAVITPPPVAVVDSRIPPPEPLVSPKPADRPVDEPVAKATAFSQIPDIESAGEPGPDRRIDSGAVTEPIRVPSAVTVTTDPPSAPDPGPPSNISRVQRAAFAPARVPLAYREILGARRREAGTGITQPITTTVGVPTGIADRVRQIHAIDVSDAVVERGPSVSVRARGLGARAFTEAGTVHLPAESGELTGPDVVPLLAHELTHVAQQREFGTALPGEGTEAGRQLEAEALAVEQWFAGGPKPPPPLRHLARARRATLTTVDPAAYSQPNSAGEFDPGSLQTILDQLSDVTTLDMTPASAPATVPAAVLERLLAEAVTSSAMATGSVVPVSALMESLKQAGAGGPEEIRTVPAPALEQALARAVGAGSAISEPAVAEAVVRQLVAEAASGEPDGRPVVLASDVERVIAGAAPTQQSGGPVIPVAAISQVLAQGSVQRPDGSSSVPAVLLEQALRQAVASSDSGGAVIPVAAVERAIAQAAPPAGHPGVPWFGGVDVPLPELSTWELRAGATEIQRATMGDVVDSGPVLPAGTGMPVVAPAALPPEYAAESEPDLAPVVRLLSEAIGAEPPRHWVDMEDTEHLDQLTKKIYDRVHDRLRRDVLVQRERSGQLMDFW